MKHYLPMLVIYLMVVTVGWGQTTPIRKPAFIFRKDKVVLEVHIEQILEQSIRFRLLAIPNGAIREVLLKDVERIRFADGTVRIIAPSGAKMSHLEKETRQTSSGQPNLPVRPTETTSPVSQAETPARQVESKPVALPISAPVAEQTKTRPFLVLTLGVEGSYMLGGESWIADSTKTGFRQGVGGSAALDIHLARWMALSVRAGLNRYTVERRFNLPEGTVAFQTTTFFQQIPLHLGVKLYPFRHGYIMPEGGVQLLTYSYQDGTKLSATASSQRLAFGGSIGTEFGGRTLRFDLSAGYHIVQVKSLGDSFASVAPVHYAGIRLGVGFIVKNKKIRP